MWKLVRRHKIISCLVIVLLIALLAVLLCFSYVWCKLGLIQYDDENTISSQVVTEYQDQSLSEEDIILSEDDVMNLREAETEPVLPDSPVWNDSDVLNILLIGTDERSESFSDNARSDSMILVSINKLTKEIKLVSLERAIGVPVLEGQYEGQYDWLTHIFRYGGPELLMKTIQTCFLVDVDYYIRINFHTVTNAIDAIGGIDIELSQEEADFLNDPDAAYMWLGQDRRTVTAGLNHLDGVTTLTYARIRKIDSDWRRVERQRKVIVAVIEKLKASGFRGLDELVNQVLPLVQTNFTRLELAEIILCAPAFINATIEQMTIPESGTYGIMSGMGGRTLYAIDFETNAELLHEYLYNNKQAN